MVKCDVMSWDEQLAMFKDALTNSPSKRIDVVVANAGVAGDPDDVHTTDRTALSTITISGKLTTASRERRSRETSNENHGHQPYWRPVHNQARTALFSSPIRPKCSFIERPVTGIAEQCGRVSRPPRVSPVQHKQVRFKGSYESIKVV